MRSNPDLDTEKAISELAVGEALVSLLDEKGRPCIVERAFILPPASRIGPITAEERTAVVKSSAVFGHYEKTVDRESAYEIIARRMESRQDDENRPVRRSGQAERAPGSSQESSQGGVMDMLGGILLGKKGPRGGYKPGALDAAAKSAARSIGSQVGREIFRGVLGGIFGSSRRR